MNEKKKAIRGRSLPPTIKGEVSGYLTMKVDEIVWCRKSCMETVVFVKWWGEDEPATFRPVNVKLNLNGFATDTSICYEIRTNISLFEEYLKDCEVLCLHVVDKDLFTVVGLVTIPELCTLIRENPYQHYFPIVNTFGNRIGDLHVVFSFQFIYEPENAHNFSIVKSVQENSRNRSMSSKEHSVNGQRRRLKQCHEHYKILPSDTSKYICDIYKSQQTRQRKIVPDSLISDILKQGQRLRDAMVRSILEDDRIISNEGIDALMSDSSTDKTLGTWNESSKVLFDEAEVMEFVFGKSMTHQDEERAMKKHVNVLPVDNLFEMAEEMGKSKDLVINCHEAFGKKYSNMFDPESESDAAASVPASEGKNSTERREECGSQIAESKEANIRPLQSETILHRDFLMKNVDSIQIRVHSLVMNNNGRNQYQDCVQAETRKMNLLNKLPVQCGTVYFVEYELVYPVDLISRGKRRIIKQQDVSKYSKNSGPDHSIVKRFCSRKKIGSDIYFGQSSLHVLPTSKASLHGLLRDVIITFRIYSRQLHQRIPSQIGEAQMGMTDILLSETFSIYKDIEVLHTTAECEIVLGVLKVKVELGSGQKYFGNNLLKEINNEGLCTEAGSDCEDVKLDIFGNNNKSTLKHVPDLRLTPRLHVSDISKRTLKKGKSFVSYKINKDQEFCKNNQQNIKLEDRVVDSSHLEINLNKPILLYGLLHISEGQGFDGLNSYMLCRAFWKEDIIISDIYCKTGYPHYNFHELIPVLLSADLLERSHNNVLVVELWERKLSANCDALMGVAKLPLNKFFVAYRDPVVAAQLLLSKYPVIGVDGWITVSNPVTGLPSGHLNVVLALGTEDQVHLLEVSRGLKEAVFTHSFQEPAPTTDNSNCNIQIASVGKLTSMEPSPCLVEDCHKPQFSGISESQARHVNNNSSITSELPQGLYEQVHVMESLQECSYNDSVPILGTQENLRSVSVDANDIMESLPSSTSELYKVKDKRKLNSGTRFQGNSGTKEFSHYIVDHQEKKSQLQSKNYQSSQSGPRLKTDSIFNAKIGTIKPSNMQENIGLSTDLQESQADILVLDLSNSDIVTLQNSPKATESEFPRCPPLDIISDMCVSNSEASNVQPGDLSDSLSCDFLQNEHIKGRLGDKELPPYCCHASLCHILTTFNSGLKDCKLLCSESERTDLNSDHFLGMINQASNASQLSSVLHESVESKSAEIDPKSYFQVHLEIERAMYLQCHSKLKGTETTGAVVQPSTYVTCQNGNKSEMKMFTPLVSHTANPSWCWHCDTWLPSDLLTDNCKRFIFKVWQSVTGYCKDPLRDIVLGFAAVDLTVLLFGMPWVSGWFNITDFAGQCSGQIKKLIVSQLVNQEIDYLRNVKISITPLENLGRFSQYKTSELNKLQGNYIGKQDSDCGCMDYQKTQGDKCNWNDGITVTSSCEVNDNSYDVPRVQSERSELQSSDIFTCETSCTDDVLTHHTSNGPNGSLSSVRDCLITCDAEFQEHTSVLSQALKQKLSELDEITQRLKKRLHFVTNEDFIPPFFPWIQGNENSLSSQAASQTVTSTNERKNSESEIASFVNKATNKENPYFKVTIDESPRHVTLGYSEFSTHTNDMEMFCLKNAEENHQIPRNVSCKCKNFQTSIVCPLQVNNSANFSGTSMHSLPQNNVTNIQCYVGKKSENDIVRKTSVNHRGSLANVCYPSDPVGSKIRGYQLGENWIKDVSKTKLNETGLLPAEIRSEVEDTDGFDKMTDYVMETSARELELENVFNPLLFHQLLSSYGQLKIPGFVDKHNLECNHRSPQVSKDTQPNIETVDCCNDCEGAAELENNVRRIVMYNP